MAEIGNWNVPSGRIPAQNSHSLQEILSRTGSFPLRVPLEFIRKYSRKNDIVLDPFCGKGTTLLAARLLNRRCFGLDIAPEAVICSSAKLANVDRVSVQSYIRSIRLPESATCNVPEEIRIFFHPSTLRELLIVRSAILRDIEAKQGVPRDNAIFALACLLGILHGHASYSLSVPCAHAFSMSPRYVAKYAVAHALKKPNRSVIECLSQKCDRVFKDNLPPDPRGFVKLGCARQVATIFPELRGKVDLIVTSPPYLNAQTYAKDNWLRLWLLRADFRELKPSYIETGSVAQYERKMFDVFRECSQLLRPGGRMIVVAGDVRRRITESSEDAPSIFQTGRCLARLLTKSDFDMTVTTRGNHSVKSSSRYFHSLNQSNGHVRSKMTERFFVATKGRASNAV